MSDGVIISNGTIVSVVSGFGGTTPAGETFVAMDATGLSAGMPAPASVAASAAVSAIASLTRGQFQGFVEALAALAKNVSTGG